MDGEKKQPSVAIAIAIIGALALIAVPIVSRLVDLYIPTPTPPANTPVIVQPNTVIITATPESKAIVITNTPDISQPVISTPTLDISAPVTENLISCSSFQNGETRTVPPGTFIMGDVKVDGVIQYDPGKSGQGTIVFIEKESSVYAQWGAGCYVGSINFKNQLVRGELEHGCGSSCTSVRFVLIPSSGQPQVEYINK